jgi:hypothetical protein
LPFFGGVEAGNMIKMEASVEQQVLSDPSFALFWGKAVQDAVIPPQPVVDIPDQVFTIPVPFVVKRIAAIVCTEFLVCPSPDWISAFHTLPVHRIPL